MIVCHVCGTENPEGSKFCEGCGVELQSVAVAAPVVVPAVAEVVAPIEAPVIADSSGHQTVIEEPLAVESAADAIPALDTPLLSGDVTPPPLPIVDEPALNVDEPVAEVVAAAVPAVAAATADSTFNSKATMETPLPTGKVNQAKLIPRSGMTGDGFVMHSERMVVGRFDPSAGPVDIDLSGGQGENYISRRHAEVYLENGVWLVRDLGSTNGVYVKRAGQAQYSPRIIEPQSLNDGDEVAFGNMKFLFVMSSDAA